MSDAKNTILRELRSSIGNKCPFGDKLMTLLRSASDHEEYGKAIGVAWLNDTVFLVNTSIINRNFKIKPNTFNTNLRNHGVQTRRDIKVGSNYKARKWVGHSHNSITKSNCTYQQGNIVVYEQSRKKPADPRKLPTDTVTVTPQPVEMAIDEPFDLPLFADETTWTLSDETFPFARPEQNHTDAHFALPEDKYPEQ